MGYEVVASAGTLGEDGDAVVRLPHRWTEAGVAVRTDFTGAHLLHLAVAGCVLNDTYREAAALGVAVRGVRVRAGGDFDTATWTSTGVAYEVELDVAPEDAGRVEVVLARVDAVAEVPRALRAGAAVDRVVRP